MTLNDALSIHQKEEYISNQGQKALTPDAIENGHYLGHKFTPYIYLTLIQPLVLMVQQIMTLTAGLLVQIGFSMDKEGIQFTPPWQAPKNIPVEQTQKGKHTKTSEIYRKHRRLAHKSSAQQNLSSTTPATTSSSATKKPSTSPQPLQLLTKQEAEAKMARNLKKAIDEHELTPLIKTSAESQKHLNNMEIKVSEHEAIGKRTRMEDSHFTLDRPEGFLVGVFDGHADHGRISAYASKQFQERFFKMLEQHPQDVRFVFQKLLNEINDEVIEKQNQVKSKTNRHGIHKEIYGGCTALVSYIDKQTGKVYTATLGDSEAFIYRKNSNGGVDCLPLSCVRNWKSTKDTIRAAEALNNPAIKKIWPRITDPKNLRFPMLPNNGGINVSRALGDRILATWNNKPGVISKAKVTMFDDLQPDDLILFACDGLWDYIKQDDLIQNVLDPYFKYPNQDIAHQVLARAIVRYTLENPESDDNVSVVALRIKENESKAKLM